MNNKKNLPKTTDKYQRIWDKFNTQYATEGYRLKKIFDIYIPFWQCKQKVVVEKDIELDRFSRIILELVSNGITTHSSLCSFLGIDENSFPIIQFHFLLKHDLLCEPEVGVYEITHEAIKFLENKKKLKKVEMVEFEYFVTERLKYLKNDLSQDFFDPNFPIDKELSEKRKKTFRGYQIMQSHRINKGNNRNARKIPHSNENRPTFNKISANRNDFASFFKDKFRGGVFYDFADSAIETHKRTICFIGLLYEHHETEGTKLDIRQSNKSVYSFGGDNVLEKKLSEQATAYISKNDLQTL